MEKQANNAITQVRSLKGTRPNPPKSYKLVLQWPKTFWDSKGIPSPASLPQFTVHGLWPQNARDKTYKEIPPSPQYPPNLDWETIESLEHSLMIHWPNLKNYGHTEESKRFWLYEWKRHGFYTDIHPLDYFSLAMVLKISLQSDLGISIGTQQEVQVAASQVKSAVQNMSIPDELNGVLIGAPATPEINCFRGQNGITQIKEVRISFDEDFTSPTNSKKMFSGDCKHVTDKVILP